MCAALFSYETASRSPAVTQSPADMTAWVVHLN